jgi:hypothetical protein
VLHGDLAAILSACAVAKTADAPAISLAGRLLLVLDLVAGTRNQCAAGTRNYLSRTSIID